MSAKVLDWPRILEAAAPIVLNSAVAMTLRALFYRLVVVELIPNTLSAYKTLSARTAKARREGWFPDLFDATRRIRRNQTFASPEEARRWLAEVYMRDRTEGQEFSLYFGVEKSALVELIWSWFGSTGIPVVALGGYSSQTFVDDVRRDADKQKRKAVLLYAGDFDPSGEDILRDFLIRSYCFDEVERVALDWEQVIAHNLPPQMGKATDSRAAAFEARHGRLVQVELDALPPVTLRDLYMEAANQYFDADVFEAVLAREAEERKQLGE
jgi:hypothetical protein